MNFDDIFAAYYTLYRGESTTPVSTDDEYIIGMRLANEAIKRWAAYDGEYWKELFTTLVAADDGDKLVIAAQKTYEVPADMAEAGGFVKIIDSDGNAVRNIPIIEPQDEQFMNSAKTYAYFTGSAALGYTLNFSNEPDPTLVGLAMNYIYYKMPTLYTTGTSISEIPDPYFVVNRMLASRFRISRNPYYNSALRDAEDCLRMMKIDNDSGTWANPWSVPDRSGSVWGY